MAGAGLGRSAVWAGGVLWGAGGLQGLDLRAEVLGCGRGGAVRPGTERGSGPGLALGRRCVAGCSLRSLGFLLFRSVPQGGRHDGPGSWPPGAAAGDFGRSVRLPRGADGRLPDSDQVRPAGGGRQRGALRRVSGESWGGTCKMSLQLEKLGSCEDVGVAGELRACCVLGDVPGC